MRASQCCTDVEAHSVPASHGEGRWNTLTDDALGRSLEDVGPCQLDERRQQVSGPWISRFYYLTSLLSNLIISKKRFLVK